MSFYRIKEKYASVLRSLPKSEALKCKKYGITKESYKKAIVRKISSLREAEKIAHYLGDDINNIFTTV